MEKETIDQIAFMASRLAIVLVALTGLQSMCGAVDAQVGPFAVVVALVCLGLCWHAHFLRDVLWQRPRLFVWIVTFCLVAMMVTFMSSAPIPSPVIPAPLA